MIDQVALARLTHELGIWRRAWRQPVMWWRDDDAREPAWQLTRLLHVRAGLPITLAVIPDVDLGPLAKKLSGHAGVSIAQHGVDHQNRRDEGGPRSEFPSDMAQDDINAALAAGRARLSAAGFDPLLFVPPWNEIDDRLVFAISKASYGAFSIGIYGKPQGGLDHIGAQVDILRWKGQPHFKGKRKVLDAIRRQLEQRRKLERWDEPIGILTHHLVHDEASWAFLDWFVQFSRKWFEWRSLADMCEPSTVQQGVTVLRRRDAPTQGG